MDIACHSPPGNLTKGNDLEEDRLDGLDEYWKGPIWHINVIRTFSIGDITSQGQFLIYFQQYFQQTKPRNGTLHIFKDTYMLHTW